MNTIITELERIKNNYDTSINLVQGLEYRQKDVIKMIEYYSNSRYLNRQTDELGLEKPFYNIVNAMCDVENAAKDIDTKDITATSDDPQHYTASFLMSKDIYEWMKETNFAKTLNEMRDTDTRYGSLLVKKHEYKDEDNKKQLEVQVVEWKNVITDQVDIANGPIIEVHYMTPTEMLKQSEWDKEAVKEAIRKNSKQGGNSYRIPVFEIRGEFPRQFISKVENKTYKPTKSDETDFSYQLYYIAGINVDIFGDVQDVTNLSFTDKMVPLYWEDDTERVYKYKARKKKAGRSFGIGVIEEGEQAQMSTNEAILSQSRAMRYTSKAIGQTASKKLKGRNMLTEVDDGVILEHDDGKPITPLNLIPSGGLQQYQNVINQWYAQYEKTTSSYAAQRGETPPSGTPFRLQATILQQSSSVFQDLQEELGIFITEIFEDWIMPYLARKINTEHILAHEFSMDELKEIDKDFAMSYANTVALDRIAGGTYVSEEEYAELMQKGDEAIKKTKTSRFLKVPKDYYKKFKSKITVNVTGEQRNKAAVLESLMSMMTLYAGNPNIAQDPVLNELFMRAVELSGAGISPVSLMGAIQDQSKKAEEMAQKVPPAGATPPAAVPKPAPQPLSLAANPV